MASILVIADDLTGAAELGGVALRYNLTVEISHAYVPGIEVDVYIVNTNTRSLSVSEALTKLQHLFAQIDSNSFDWIYLKFDSALRGHIYQEISLYKTIFKVDTVFFCPVNPALGRVIRDGKYWIDKKLISQTSFADDPEFPIRTDQVLDILDASDWTLQQVTHSGEMIGVQVFEVQNLAEIQILAGWGRDGHVFAGAAAYFDALLAQRFAIDGVSSNPTPDPDTASVDLGDPILYVCGSTHANSRRWLEQQPEDSTVLWDALDFSVDERIIAVLKEKSKAIFAFADDVGQDAQELRHGMAQIVKQVFSTYKITELCIEGGATAYEILKELEIDTFTPVLEWSNGVIRSKVKNKDLYITLKPGSYQWSTGLSSFDTVLNQ